MRLIPFMLMAALLRAIASSRCSSSSCGSAAATCRGRPLLSVGKSATVAGLQVRAALKQIAKSRNTFFVTRQARELEEKIEDYKQENPRPPLFGKDTSENHIYLEAESSGSVTDSTFEDERFETAVPDPEVEVTKPGTISYQDYLDKIDRAYKDAHPNWEAEAKAAEEKQIRRFTLMQDLVTAGYKALLAKHHPDKSTGSTEAKIELDEVRDELQELVESHYTDRTKAAARRAP